MDEHRVLRSAEKDHNRRRDRRDNQRFLEFYVYNNVFDEETELYGKVSASIPTPENWVGEWHHVAGTFDGENVTLYIK